MQVSDGGDGQGGVTVLSKETQTAPRPTADQQSAALGLGASSQLFVLAQKQHHCMEGVMPKASSGPGRDSEMLKSKLGNTSAPSSAYAATPTWPRCKTGLEQTEATPRACLVSSPTHQLQGLAAAANERGQETRQPRLEKRDVRPNPWNGDAGLH